MLLSQLIAARSELSSALNLSVHACVDTTQVQFSPLMQVIDQNEENLSMVELLLDAGAVINETLVTI